MRVYSLESRDSRVKFYQISVIIGPVSLDGIDKHGSYSQTSHDVCCLRIFTYREMEIVITTLSIVTCHSTGPLVYLLEGSRKVTEELLLARLDSDLEPERRAVISV